MLSLGIGADHGAPLARMHACKSSCSLPHPTCGTVAVLLRGSVATHVHYTLYFSPSSLQTW